MKRTALQVCLAAVCLIAVATAGWTQQPQNKEVRKVTLQDAISLALANNNSITIAREVYNQSVGRIKEVRSDVLPQLDVTASTQETGPLPKISLGGGPSVAIGTSNTTTATAALTQVIDLNGRKRLSTDIASLQSYAQRLDLEQTERQVILDTQTVFYTVRLAQAQLEVVMASLTAAREQLRISQAQFDAGTAPKFDVTRAQVEVANIEQSAITAGNRIELGKAALNTVMGLDATSPIEVVSEQPKAEPLKESLENSVKLATTNRPEVKAAQLHLDASKKGISFAKRERIPTLSAMANYNYSGPSSLFRPNTLTWVVGLTTSFPLFDGGAISARVSQAKNGAGAAEAALAQVKLNVTLEVAVSMLDVNEALERSKTTTQNVAEAEEALRLAQVRYQSGIAVQVEVTDAEEALTRARSNHVSALYDYATALARYQKATATQPQYASAPETAGGAKS